MPIIRTISGLRFTLNEMKPELIKNYASAFNLYLNEGKIVIGTDGRPSGTEILKVLTEKLLNIGRNIELIGIVPTPTLQLFTEQHQAAGGICITASHNPENWNGLKFINSDGTFLNQLESEIFWGYLDKNTNNSTNSAVTTTINENAIAEHINKITNLHFIKENINNITTYLKQNKIKIVIDAVNSAGSKAIPMLLDTFNADYIKLFCDENGKFPHNPEPLPQNLTNIADFIKSKTPSEEKYIGIAVDPDADRLVLIDETGNCVSEEKTICIAIDAFYTLNPNSKGNIVVNQSTTMLTDWIAEKYNKKVERSAVGEINVVTLMKKNNADIGGEGSGGVILPTCHYGRDALVGTTLLLTLLSKKNIALNELIKSYPDYKMIKIKLNIEKNTEKILENVKKANINNNISEIDGIKIQYNKGWAHLRASNTEPIIRIIAEAETLAQANTYLRNIESVIKE